MLPSDPYPFSTSNSMPSAAALEQYLTGQRLPGLPLPGEFVLPDYSLSIANLPATLITLLGGKTDGLTPPLPAGLWGDLAAGLRRVVWITLDAVGWLHFRRFLADEPQSSFARLVRTGRLVPLTSIFPSTTTSALTSLWTGQVPARHGLVGHEMYLRDFGLIMDSLGFSPAGEPRRQQLIERGLKLETFLPVPGLAELLARGGVITRTVISAALAESALSRLLFRGVTEVIGGVSPADLWVGLRRALAAHRDEQLLVTGYWDEVDRISHYYGPDSESWAAELRSMAFSLDREFLQRLEPGERAGTLLVITADHGQVTLRPESPVPLAHHLELRDYLWMPPTGGPRSSYLFVRPDWLDQARQYCQTRLAEQFVVIDSAAALAGGLLGPGPAASETAARLGDLVLLPRSDFVLEIRERKRPLYGGHGGLTVQEMLVPLLLARLD